MNKKLLVSTVLLLALVDKQLNAINPIKADEGKVDLLNKIK
ncbi:hypothetical protein AB9N12_02545 [Bacteroides sp. AN502(2024)]